MPQLYDFQVKDVDRMVEQLVPGGVVWNLSDMRTGKMITFIELCRRLYEADEISKVLIVAPLSTLWSVRDEFQRWLGWQVYINPILPYAGCDVIEGREPYVVAVNKEKLRKRDHWIFAAEWDLALIDEAHHYRGRQSQQTKGMFKLKADRLVFATGTPLLNGVPAELWPMLKVTFPTVYTSFWRYLNLFAADVIGFNGVAQDVRAPWRTGMRQTMQGILAPITIRRTYAEVRPDLPPMIEQTIHLRLYDLDPQHYDGYKQLEAEWRLAVGDETIEVPTQLALTMRLRQYAASPANLFDTAGYGGKVAAIKEWVGDATGKGIVWCVHRSMAHLLQEALDRPGRICLRVDGGYDPELRGQLCQSFQADDDAILVATIGSLKEGVSLDTASWAAFAEVDWTPSANQQAAARILGPNQQGSPLVVTFTLEDTLEKHVEQVLARKDKSCNEFLLFKELVNGSREVH